MASVGGTKRLRNIWFIIVLLQTLFLCFLLLFVKSEDLQTLVQKDRHLGSQDENNDTRQRSDSCLYLPRDAGYLSSEPWMFGELGQLLFGFGLSENRFHLTPSATQLHYTRQLVLNTVHMINEHTKGNPAGCSIKWWANPLTASRISVTLVNYRTRKWNLQFNLEPGRIRVAVVVFQNRTFTNETSINLRHQKKFKLHSVKVLNSTGITKLTYYRDAQESKDNPRLISDTLVNLCLCKDDLEEANQRTMEARTAWNKADPELTTWPLSASFMITDYIDYLDPNFFLISPEDSSYCGPGTRMIVGVLSTPEHFKLRSAIRETYGNKEDMTAFNSILVFFLGTVNDEILQESVNLEAKQFKDIVQANFLDSYHNLTLKRLTIYQWIYLKCGTGNGSQRMPEYLLKAEDDFMLNVEVALKLGDANRDSSGLIGTVLCRHRPFRNPDDEKYYVPRYIWLPEMYHESLSGSTSLTMTDLIPSLLQESLTTPLMHMEDVYIQELSHINPRYSPLFPDGTLPDDMDPCTLKNKISLIISGVDDMYLQWQRLNTSQELPEFQECILSQENLSTIPGIC